MLQPNFTISDGATVLLHVEAKQRCVVIALILPGELSNPGNNEPFRIYPQACLIAEERIQSKNLLLPKTRQRILECQRSADWKGEGSQEVSKYTCETAVDVVENVLAHGLPEPTSFGPSVHGAIGLTWRNADFMLFVEVLTSSEMSFQLVGREIQRRNGKLDAIQLIATLKDLYTNR